MVAQRREVLSLLFDGCDVGGPLEFARDRAVDVLGATHVHGFIAMGHRMLVWILHLSIVVWYLRLGLEVALSVCPPESPTIP